MAFPFLPMTPEEAGPEPLDVILVTGDAYVDHNSFGVALIGRWLEAHGYRVGVIAQPKWDRPADFAVLGRPRLFFGVTSGNMDSMVNHYTAARRIRNDDAYSPGGRAGLRPDRACIAYANRVKQAFPGVPVVLGGIEASLRRIAHYDYWQDRMRRSILLDAKADLLLHGMAERSIVEIARRLSEGRTLADCRDLPGTAFALGRTSAVPNREHVEVPSFEECNEDSLAFNRLTLLMYRESNPHCGRRCCTAAETAPSGATRRTCRSTPPRSTASTSCRTPTRRTPATRADPGLREHPRVHHREPRLQRRLQLLRAHAAPGQGRGVAQQGERRP